MPTLMAVTPPPQETEPAVIGPAAESRAAGTAGEPASRASSELLWPLLCLRARPARRPGRTPRTLRTPASDLRNPDPAIRDPQIPDPRSSQIPDPPIPR